MGLIDNLVALVPGKPRILQAAARLPPRWRSRPSWRVASALARRTTLERPTLQGNFGIASRLTCEIPTAHMVALYGSPALYAGERGALELAVRLSSVSDIFVDVGAHLGYFTLLVSERGPAGLPIHYFEPDPDLYAALDRNVRANRLSSVTGHREAMGGRDGVAQFYVNRTDTLSGSLTADFADRHALAATDVTVRRFATFGAGLGFGRACVKVDVEGAEWDFMDGAAGTFDRITYVIMEVLGPAHRRRFVQQMQTRSGFNAYYINDYALEPSVNGEFVYREPEYNWLFCRESPAELAALLAASPLTVRM